METMKEFIFLDSKITEGNYYSHKIKRHLLLGRKTMRNLDSTSKSKDITLLENVHIVKAMVFPVVMCGCELNHNEGVKELMFLNCDAGEDP